MGKRLQARKEIQVSDKHIGLRIVLFVALLAIGIGFLVYGCVTMDEGYEGWQRLEISSEEAICGADIVGEYFCGATEAEARDEYRAANVIYNRACEEGTAYFYADGELAKINAAPNQEVTVSQPVYEALELMADSRYLYLGPVIGTYEDLFIAETDMQASQWDPAKDAETKASVRAMIAYCSDPQKVSLELLGDRKVRLKVSADYLRFAEENEIDRFIDFGWLTNAFIVDHIADCFQKAGYTNGHFASIDGFTRNLDDRNISYDQNIYNREGRNVDIAGSFSYTKPITMVYVRDYPLSAKDYGHYYSYQSGDRIVTSYLDPEDGMSKASVHNLVVYSRGKSCAEAALAMAPVYIADEFSRDALQALKADGIYGVWFEGQNLYYNEEGLTLTKNIDCMIDYKFSYCK